MIFQDAAKVKIIAQVAAVASGSVANKVLISERAPCCREAWLEGSYCTCSDWNFAYTCLLCVWWGCRGHNTESRFLSLAWVPVRVFGKTSRKVLCTVLPVWFWCLVLSCVSQMWDCWFPSMLSDKKKKACVWRMEYGLNHSFWDSESWALNCGIVEEFSFGVFLKQEWKWLKVPLSQEIYFPLITLSCFVLKCTSLCRIQVLILNLPMLFLKYIICIHKNYL